MVLFCHQVKAQTVKVKFGITNKTTIEGNKEEINIPIKINGAWPDTSKTKNFKVKIGLAVMLQRDMILQ